MVSWRKIKQSSVLELSCELDADVKVVASMFGVSGVRVGFGLGLDEVLQGGALPDIASTAIQV